MPEGKNTGALTEAVYYILLSLYTPLHGYGIMQKVSEMSNHRVNLGSGTLYGAINTLIKKNYIIQSDTQVSSRKKEYIITNAGKEAVSSELERLKELVTIGESLKHLEGGGF